ncbi:membrane protein [Stutzerimonas stutzeri]|uniref:Membrane protein n=1 Tax=Stutzerimonas stutzeri TaxID=316 RepID=W8RP75_STUST|nr:tripartite tricarboxylate transporter TctB family protein [Stutzerimonas stutzeri]AHL73821.1 membrane protein [Stutzerimonas stutzeri]MCQ4328663.1 tripartite tricarboxylate transporter TctB family protein [Stutzerimonas stutzeri]
MNLLSNPRHLASSGLILLIGLGTLLGSLNYEAGTSARMGPGYFPMVLGALLLLIGVLHLATPSASGQDEEEDGPPQYRGWVCVIGGMLAFIVLGAYAGLIPATFSLIFISALGDKENSLTTAALLALCMTVIAVLVFSYGLQIQFPLLRGV